MNLKQAARYSMQPFKETHCFPVAAHRKDAAVALGSYNQPLLAFKICLKTESKIPMQIKTRLPRQSSYLFLQRPPGWECSPVLAAVYVHAAYACQGPKKHFEHKQSVCLGGVLQRDHVAAGLRDAQPQMQLYLPERQTACHTMLRALDALTYRG